MRVIAGSARGRRLESPAGDRVRPTLDRVREALFNIWAGQTEGARFLDLFAGSGANGIEALSRGAQRCLFVDSHPASVACINKNLQSTGFTPRGRCIRGQLPAEIHRLQGPFDLIFADPPYAYPDHGGFVQAVVDSGLLAPDGLMAIEHGAKVILPDTVGPLHREKPRRYGSTALSVYA